MSLHLNIAVCDDERPALRIISAAAESAFQGQGAEPEIDTFSSARELLSALDREKYDLLLLDVDMPEIDGVELGRRLQDGNRNIPIVYVSSREDRVFECLPIHPFGFVRKGQFIKDMTAVASSFVAQYSRTHGQQSLVITERGHTLCIPVHDIVYIEGAAKQQIVHLRQGDPVAITQSLNQLEDALKQYGFLRIHKGYLVNYRFVRRLTAADAVLIDGEKLPVSRRKEAEVKLQYMDLIQGAGNIIL